MRRTFLFIMAAMTLITIAFAANAQTANIQTAKDLILQRQGEGDLPVIHAQKGFSTLIEFPADQKIIDVTCGDKESWVVEGGGRYLHVKPAKEGVVTNLNVLMDGDVVYAFVLREISRAGGATETADLHVTVKRAEDPTRRDKELASVAKELESLKASSPQVAKDPNEKPQGQAEKK